MTKEEIRLEKIKAQNEILVKIFEIKGIYDRFRFSTQIGDRYGFLLIRICESEIWYNNSDWVTPKEAHILGHMVSDPIWHEVE